MQEKKDRRRNADRSADMRDRLITAARALFSEKGYAETSTPEVVRAASVTRGALYHHFADKAALFEAVVVAEADALRLAIEAAATPGQDGFDAGSQAFFTAMTVPGRSQLLLVDGPAVLGWRRMADIDAGGGRAALTDGLAALHPNLDPPRLSALAHLLSAAYDAAALAIADGADPQPYHAAIALMIPTQAD